MYLLNTRVDFFVFNLDNKTNRIDTINIAINIWIVIFPARRLLSTTVFPSHAWNKIPISDKNASIVIDLCFLINLSDLDCLP